MTTLGEGAGPPVTSVYSGAVRSSVSSVADAPGAAHKHLSPHIGQIDSGKGSNGVMRGRFSGVSARHCI